MRPHSSAIPPPNAIVEGLCNFPADSARNCDGNCTNDANGDGQVGIMDLLDVLDSFGSYCQD